MGTLNVSLMDVLDITADVFEKNPGQVVSGDTAIGAGANNKSSDVTFDGATKPSGGEVLQVTDRSARQKALDLSAPNKSVDRYTTDKSALEDTSIGSTNVEMLGNLHSQLTRELAENCC